MSELQDLLAQQEPIRPIEKRALVNRVQLVAGGGERDIQRGERFEHYRRGAG